MSESADRQGHPWLIISNKLGSGHTLLGVCPLFPCRGAMREKIKIQNIIIIGAGTMGWHIAQLLQREKFEVTVIDRDRRVLEDLADLVDVQTLEGNGVNPEILHTAGVEKAQLVLALTDQDEANLMAAYNAKRMGAAKTVARARSRWCMDTSRINLRESLGLDLLLNPEALTASEIVKFLENPDVQAVSQFAQGKVQLRQFVLDSRSACVGKSLKDCGLPSGVLMAVLSRNGGVRIPHGDQVLQEGDKVSLIGLPVRLAEAQKMLRAPHEPLRRVVIAGGGNSGYFLAQTLEKREFQIHIIDPDPDRCIYLSRHLQNATVMRGDVTRRDFLREEHLESPDAFIALMGTDEDNIMACLLAKDMGARQTIARINRPDYATLIQKTGVDLTVSPRHIMGDRILSMILGGKIQALSLLEEGRVEVIELVAEQGAPILGKRLREVQLGEEALISTIVRKEKVIVPRGDDQVEPGDTVIAVGLRDQMDRVESLFTS